MFWHKYGMQVTGTSLGAALLGVDAYDDRLKHGAAQLIRHILDISDAQAVNLTGVMWGRSLNGKHVLMLASGPRQISAEFASEQLALFPSRDAPKICNALHALVAELGTPHPQVAPESVEKFVF